jgi:SAM-dependent methyltransferase
MDASIDDKLRVLNVIPHEAEYILDVGCASGHVTAEMARQRPRSHFHGIDVELPFVGMAQSQPSKPANVSYSHNWLSDLHQYKTRYDVIMFMSVLHEFYSYGKGITSVVKALCDAYELLNPGGMLIIRDMLRPDNVSNIPDRMTLTEKIASVVDVRTWYDYDEHYIVSAGNIMKVNDLLLHLLYQDNWDNEVEETYMFWTVKDYIKFCQQLQLDPIAQECYRLEYVEERWKKELWLNQMEIQMMYTTGIIAFQK